VEANKNKELKGARMYKGEHSVRPTGEITADVVVGLQYGDEAK
jgi:hypothetical protein